MKLQIGDNRVGISFDSLVLFLVFTAAGTVLGAIAYQWLLPYLPASITNPQLPKAAIPGLTTST